MPAAASLPNFPTGEADSLFVEDDDGGTLFAGKEGLISIDGFAGDQLIGDVLLVDPGAGRAERLLRSGSAHNTLLVTERCDQLCVMCSQPPKKTHIDRFDHFEKACKLAEPGSVIGITGGEPTLYKPRLLDLIEAVLTERADLEFHVLTNGQHFDQADVPRLRAPLYHRVSWGIPLYCHVLATHDFIVGKQGAFDRLHASFSALMQAGARIELRTVLTSTNLQDLPALSQYVAARLRFVESGSVMQLENIGFAKNRWSDLFVDMRRISPRYPGPSTRPCCMASPSACSTSPGARYRRRIGRWLPPRFLTGNASIRRPAGIAANATCSSAFSSGILMTRPA